MNVGILDCVIGLPEKDDPFDERNLDVFWKGESLIQDDELSLLPSKLGSKMKSICLNTSYQVPSSVVDKMDLQSQYAVAAGLELMKKMELNIYNHKKRIIGLPERIQNITGVISVGSFSSHISFLEQNDPTNLPSTFIYKVTVRPCAHLSLLLQTKGPSIHMDAACASTLHAISLAKDWIQIGRCKQVIIIGSELSCNPLLLPYLNHGFNNIGVLNVNSYIGAFEKNRKGMTLGSGAFSMMITQESLINKSFSNSFVEILDINISNSCYHVISLDLDFIIDKLKTCIDGVCEKLGISRKELASQLCYFSHETSTPACASTEIEALQTIFEDDFSVLSIANTKCITGHCLGVGLEDPIAFKSLVLKKCPYTICNNPDELLGNLLLTKGEPHNRSFILRFSAGFGGYVAVAMYQLI